jgi:hypothetical protein
MSLPLSAMIQQSRHAYDFHSNDHQNRLRHSNKDIISITHWHSRLALSALTSCPLGITVDSNCVASRVSYQVLNASYPFVSDPPDTKIRLCALIPIDITCYHTNSSHGRFSTNIFHAVLHSSQPGWPISLLKNRPDAYGRRQ